MVAKHVYLETIVHKKIVHPLLRTILQPRTRKTPLTTNNFSVLTDKIQTICECKQQTLVPILVSANHAGNSPKNRHPSIAIPLTVDKISLKLVKVFRGSPYQ